MDKELEKLSKAVPNCMKKRSCSNKSERTKMNSFYTNYYSTKVKECK